MQYSDATEQRKGGLCRRPDVEGPSLAGCAWPLNDNRVRREMIADLNAEVLLDARDAGVETIRHALRHVLPEALCAGGAFEKPARLPREVAAIR